MDGNFGSSSSTQGKTPPTSSVSTKSQRQNGVTIGSELEEDSESDSESSSSSIAVTSVLENFREEWKAELKHSIKSQKTSNCKIEITPQLEIISTTRTTLRVSDTEMEAQAKEHFIMGVALERQGKLYDAVRCYRRAIQMVPDIESRVEANTMVESSNDSEEEFDSGDFQVLAKEYDGSEPLSRALLRAIEANGWEYFQKAKKDDKTYIGNMPVEVITYILRWVISSDLDVRSLDVLSGVNRGFYCLCRDEQLWKMACDKVWNVVDLLTSGFSSYREMFLLRTRVRLDGCYISKVSYVRPGEHSFQDQSYRPWHFVEYYRYVRFFPSGDLYFLTTPDPPSIAISMLKERPPRNSAILKGCYRIVGDDEESNVHCTALKTNLLAPTPTRHGRNSKDLSERTEFHMYFRIDDMKNKCNWILRWSHYTVCISKAKPKGNNGNAGLILNDNIDINPNKFPPLYFSRVKSFVGRAENILE